MDTATSTECACDPDSELRGDYQLPGRWVEDVNPLRWAPLYRRLWNEPWRGGKTFAIVGKSLAELMPGGLMIVGASRARTYYYDLMVLFGLSPKFLKCGGEKTCSTQKNPKLSKYYHTPELHSRSGIYMYATPRSKFALTLLCLCP